MEEFEGHATVFISDVDCTAAGKSLCQTMGVSGYPTIKYGDPNDLEKYQGGRDEASLKKFASELKPLCSPMNMDLCDEEGKAKIAEVQALSDEELDAKIADAEKKVAESEATFEAEVAKLQATYDELVKKKEEDKDEAAFKAGVSPLQANYGKLQDAKNAVAAAVKADGLGLLKSVKASRSAVPAAEGKDEL